MISPASKTALSPHQEQIRQPTSEGIENIYFCPFTEDHKICGVVLGTSENENLGIELPAVPLNV